MSNLGTNPKKEVRIGLMKSLLPNYLRQYTADGLSTIPQCDNTDYEGHYQSLLYTIFSLLGMYVDVEVHTPKGRVDIAMCAPTTLYVVELKLNKTADIALEQIH